MIFWQSPRTRKQSRPKVAVSRARAFGVRDLEILVDTRERYAWKFGDQQVRTSRVALQCGDYAVRGDAAVIAAVRRKSAADLLSSMATGKLRIAMSELATL